MNAETPIRRETAKSGSLGPAQKKGKAGSARPARSGRIETGKDLSNLPSMTATQVKKGGWPGVMNKVHKASAITVTNHQRTEAVILTAEHYAALVQRAPRSVAGPKPAAASGVGKEIALARLQSEFDRRLAVLKDGTSLTATVGKSARRGKIKLRSSF